jgi:hypothetical protein
VQPLDDGFVLRLHETEGARGTTELHLHARPRRTALVDLLGEPLAPVDGALPYGPYQILSVRVWR